jgi:hypothetical protein
MRIDDPGSGINVSDNITPYQMTGWDKPTTQKGTNMKPISNFKEAVLFFIAISFFSIFAGVIAFAFLVVLSVILAGTALFAFGCAAVSLFQIKDEK